MNGSWHNLFILLRNYLKTSAKTGIYYITKPKKKKAELQNNYILKNQLNFREI